MDLEQIKNDVKEMLSEKRYIHSIGVMERAEELALIYGEDVQTAKLVGLAHDIAKELSEEEILQYVKENNIEVDEIEREQLYLLHGKIGADMCSKKYGFTEYMKKAIERHTTGDKEMSKLDKIIFIADKTEKNRKHSDLQESIEICNRNLDEGVIYCLEYAVKTNLDKHKLVHPNTIIARNSILMQKFKNEM